MSELGEQKSTPRLNPIDDSLHLITQSVQKKNLTIIAPESPISSRVPGNTDQRLFSPFVGAFKASNEPKLALNRSASYTDRFKSNISNLKESKVYNTDRETRQRSGQEMMKLALDNRQAKEEVEQLREKNRTLQSRVTELEATNRWLDEELRRLHKQAERPQASQVSLSRHQKSNSLLPRSLEFSEAQTRPVPFDEVSAHQQFQISEFTVRFEKSATRLHDLMAGFIRQVETSGPGSNPEEASHGVDRLLLEFKLITRSHLQLEAEMREQLSEQFIIIQSLRDKLLAIGFDENERSSDDEFANPKLDEDSLSCSSSRDRRHELRRDAKSLSQENLNFKRFGKAPVVCDQLDLVEISEFQDLSKKRHLRLNSHSLTNENELHFFQLQEISKKVQYFFSKLKEKSNDLKLVLEFVRNSTKNLEQALREPKTRDNSNIYTRIDITSKKAQKILQDHNTAFIKYRVGIKKEMLVEQRTAQHSLIKELMKPLLESNYYPQTIRSTIEKNLSKENMLGNMDSNISLSWLAGLKDKLLKEISRLIPSDVQPSLDYQQKIEDVRTTSAATKSKMERIKSFVEPWGFGENYEIDLEEAKLEANEAINLVQTMGALSLQGNSEVSDLQEGKKLKLQLLSFIQSLVQKSATLIMRSRNVNDGGGFDLRSLNNSLRRISEAIRKNQKRIETLGITSSFHENISDVNSPKMIMHSKRPSAPQVTSRSSSRFNKSTSGIDAEEAHESKIEKGSVELMLTEMFHRIASDFLT